jgi:hypothetical protein
MEERVKGERRWVQLAIDYIWKGKIKERLIIITKNKNLPTSKIFFFFQSFAKRAEI